MVQFKVVVVGSLVWVLASSVVVVGLDDLEPSAHDPHEDNQDNAKQRRNDANQFFQLEGIIPLMIIVIELDGVEWMTIGHKCTFWTCAFKASIGVSTSTPIARILTLAFVDVNRTLVSSIATTLANGALRTFFA